MHEAEPEVPEKDPAGHSEHDPDPAPPPNVPFAHGVHSVALFSENVPAEHVVQDVPPPVEYVPAKHSRRLRFVDEVLPLLAVTTPKLRIAKNKYTIFIDKIIETEVKNFHLLSLFMKLMS